ncbi:MAG: extracellular solute-binding protein [Clostridiales bacterium]|nr:extracellular solute-binding protein [Clostridiales bacterium]
MAKKRILAVLLAAAVTSSMLTACGGNEQKDEAGNTDKKTEEVSSSGEADDSEEASSGKETVLKFFDLQAYGLEEFDEVVKAFEEEHPGVKVEVQHAPNDGNALLQSRVNSGDVPDVFAVESGTLAEMYYDYAYDWTQDTETTGLFGEAALEMGKDSEGNIKALPWSYANMGLIYNKESFEKAGITELPTTMDELEEACVKLDKAGIPAISLAAKEVWVLAQTATHFMMDKEMDAAGTDAALKSGELTFDALPHWENLFRFLDLAVKYGPDKPLEVDWETSENMLANGDAAMIHMGDWCQSTLDSFNPDAQLGFLPFPVGDSEDDTTLLTCCNWVYIVHKDSENLELAKEFAKFALTSEKGQYWTCDGVGAVPAVTTDREVKGALANDASGYISAGKTNGWIHTIAPSGYSETCGPYLQAYMTGDMSAEEITQLFQEFYTSGN